MDFWEIIKTLKGQTLRTLDRGYQFQILDIYDSGIIIRLTSTGKERLVSKKEIENALRELMVVGHITRSQIEAEHSARNPVYVASILAQLPDVRHSIKPILLQHRKS